MYELEFLNFDIDLHNIEIRRLLVGWRLLVVIQTLLQIYSHLLHHSRQFQDLQTKGLISMWKQFI